MNMVGFFSLSADCQYYMVIICAGIDIIIIMLGAAIPSKKYIYLHHKWEQRIDNIYSINLLVYERYIHIIGAFIVTNIVYLEHLLIKIIIY